MDKTMTTFKHLVLLALLDTFIQLKKKQPAELLSEIAFTNKLGFHGTQNLRRLIIMACCTI